NIRHQWVGIRCDDRGRPDPLAVAWVLPVLPDAADAERLAVLHRDSVGLLRLLPLDRLPLEEPIHRHDAPAQPVRIAEGRQRPNRFALRIDRLAAAAWIQAPAQRIKRHFARAVVTPDDQQVLAWRRVPP